MKYVITWKPRAGGSAADNEASAARFSTLTRGASPSADATIHQFVVRIDGNGGFAVVESDGAAAIARTLFRLSTLNEYTVYPVIDYEEGIRIGDEADEFRASVQ